MATIRIKNDDGEDAPVFDQRRHFLDDQKLNQKSDDGNEQPNDEHDAAAHCGAAAVGAANVRPEDVHRVIAEARDHRQQSAPTKIPQRRQ